MLFWIISFHSLQTMKSKTIIICFLLRWTLNLKPFASSFIDHDQDVHIVEEYDRKFSYKLNYATYNQWAIFYKLIFVSEDWPIDPRSSCCSPSNLVQLIEINLNLEKEFEIVF